MSIIYEIVLIPKDLFSEIFTFLGKMINMFYIINRIINAFYIPYFLIIILIVWLTLQYT